MNIKLDMKNGRAIFSQIQDRNTRANFCKKWFLSTKYKNDNEAAATINFLYDTNGTTNFIKLK